MDTKKRKKNFKEGCFTAVSTFLVISTLAFSAYCFERSKTNKSTFEFSIPVLALAGEENTDTKQVLILETKQEVIKEEKVVEEVKEPEPQPTKTPQRQIINNISQSDKLLLAKTICGETGRLSYISDTERRWIVWTILNRVKSNYSTFASQHSVFEVITRKNQFTPMNSNGDLIKASDRTVFNNNKDYFMSIVDSCMYMESETNALYYCNYSIISNSNKEWFNTLTKLSTPDGFVHSFYDK